MKYIKIIISILLSIVTLLKAFERFGARNPEAGYLFVFAAIAFAFSAIFFYKQISKNK